MYAYMYLFVYKESGFESMKESIDQAGKPRSKVKC